MATRRHLSCGANTRAKGESRSCRAEARIVARSRGTAKQDACRQEARFPASGFRSFTESRSLASPSGRAAAGTRTGSQYKKREPEFETRPLGLPGALRRVSGEKRRGE